MVQQEITTKKFLFPSGLIDFDTFYVKFNKGAHLIGYIIDNCLIYMILI